MDNAGKIILVTGASGTQGEAAAYALLKAGFKVRAFVHKSDAKKLEQAGAEIHRGSFDEPETLFKAMDGAFGVFSMQNPDFAGEGTEKRHAQNIVDSALKAGVKQIVQTTVNREGEHEKFAGWDAGRWNKGYWIGKHDAVEVVVNAGFEYWTILKPVVLMDNFLALKAKQIYPHLKEGLIVTAFNADTKLQMIAADDVGKFAAAAFSDPQGYHQKRVNLAAEALTMSEVAEKLSKVLGKNVKALNLAPKEAIAKGEPEIMVVRNQWVNEVGYNADIEALKQYNIPLTSFEEWVQKHKDEFEIGS